MKILINTISPISTLIAFEDKQIFYKKEIKVIWEEFSIFLDLFIQFLEENNIEKEKIEWISIVNWPWWFTWTRVIALIVNTFWYIYKTPLEQIDLFTLIIESWWKYPIAIKANRWEYLFKKSTGDTPKILNKDELELWGYFGIWNVSDFQDKNISFNETIDYNSFIVNHEFKYSMQRIEPYYIKKPNIT